MTRDEAAMVLIAKVIVREGGVGQVPGETWITRWGQTPAWLASFGFETPKSAEDAARNYRTWLVRTGLIGLCECPDSLADAVIDFAVNSSHRPAIEELQRALGFQGANADGIWGPETQAAVDTCDRSAMARRVLAGRLRFMGALITRKPEKYARYAKGWMARLGAQVEALS